MQQPGYITEKTDLDISKSTHSKRELWQMMCKQVYCKRTIFSNCTYMIYTYINIHISYRHIYISIYIYTVDTCPLIIIHHFGLSFGPWLHLWKTWKSVGIIIPNLYGKLKVMFQTTNQIFAYPLRPHSFVRWRACWTWPLGAGHDLVFSLMLQLFAAALVEIPIAIFSRRHWLSFTMFYIILR